MAIQVRKPQTREEALAIAKEIIKKAKERPDRKEELKQQFMKWSEENKHLFSEKSTRGGYYTADEDYRLTPRDLITKSASFFGEDRDIVAEFQKFNDYLILKSAILEKPVQVLPEYREFMAGKHPIAKELIRKSVFTTSASGSGQEWVPDVLSERFVEEIDQSEIVAKIHETITVPEGMGSLKLPAETGTLNIYRMPESSEDERNAAPVASGITTRAVTLDPEYYWARVPIEEQYSESVPFDVVERIRKKLIEAAVKGKDNVLINGDTNVSSSMDSDLTSSTDIRTIADGYRKLTNSAAKIDASGSLGLSHVQSALKAMGKFGNPNDIVCVTSMLGWWELATISELITRAEYTGEPLVPNQIGITKLGFPVMYSDQVRSDLNASGVYDGSTTSYTIILFVNKKAFVIGDRRKATIEVTTEALTGRKNLIVKGAFDFQPLYDTSTYNVVSYIYGVA